LVSGDGTRQAYDFPLPPGRNPTQPLATLPLQQRTAVASRRYDGAVVPVRRNISFAHILPILKIPFLPDSTFSGGAARNLGGYKNKKQLIQKENITTTNRFKNLML